MSWAVSVSQCLMEALSMDSFLDTTLVRRVMRPRGWRVLLLSRSMATVPAVPMTWRSLGALFGQDGGKCIPRIGVKDAIGQVLDLAIASSQCLNITTAPTLLKEAMPPFALCDDPPL